jgi:hypothetical protein
VYPIFYAGAGMTCAAIGRYVAVGVRRWLPATDEGPFERHGAAAIAIWCTAVLVGVTNLDLFGDPSFYLRWWTFWEKMTF